MGSHAAALARANAFKEVTDGSLEAQLNEATLRANDYPQDRGIFKRGAADNLNHIDFFGDCYLHALKNMGDGDIWLHIGPGDFYAETDFFKSALFSRQAKVISNAYCLSNSEEATTNLRFLEQFKCDGRFQCVDGIKFQELKLSPCSVKVIGDVFAAGSYDEDLFGFFRKASELLVPDGLLAVVLASVTFNSTDGTLIQAREIYDNMGAFKIVNHTENSGWVFRRTNDQFIEPKNELKSFKARNREEGIMWPIRSYRIL